MKAGCAYGKENEVGITRVSNALPATRRNEDGIAGTHILSGQVTDFGAAPARKNEITFCDTGQAVPAGSDTGFDTGAGDGTIRVFRGVN